MKSCSDERDTTNLTEESVGRLPLELDCYETMHLVDGISVGDNDTGNPDNPDSNEPLAHELLLLLSVPFLALIQEEGYVTDKKVTVLVTLKQVRLLKEKVRTGDKHPSGALVGITLTRKLLQLFQDFDSGRECQEVGTLKVGTIEEGHLTRRQIKATRRSLRDAGPSTNTDSDAHIA